MRPEDASRKLGEVPGGPPTPADAAQREQERFEMMAFTGCSEDDVDGWLAIEHGEENAGCCGGIDSEIEF